jgi:hypothetical protein
MGDLDVLTSLNQLLFILKILYTFVTKQAILILSFGILWSSHYLNKSSFTLCRNRAKLIRFNEQKIFCAFKTHSVRF